MTSAILGVGDLWPVRGRVRSLFEDGWLGGFPHPSHIVLIASVY